MNNHFGISVLWLWIEQATKEKKQKKVAEKNLLVDDVRHDITPIIR